MAIPSVPSTPLNPNILHPNKYVVSVDALPTVKYWCQGVNVPGISLGEVPRQTPFIDLYSPGEKLIINPFSMTFLIDEDLKGWLEIYTWMRGMTFPVTFDEYKNLDKRIGAWASGTKFPQFSDMTLTIFDSKQNPNIRIRFFNCYPTTLTDILLSATASPEEPLTADAIFRFDIYEIQSIKD